MDDRKDSPKLMHDVTAKDDPKVRRLLRSEGFAGYGRFWRVCEYLRVSRGCRLDSSEPGFWEIWAEELHLSEDDTKEFFARLCPDDKSGLPRFGLLKTDGRFYWSERICRDVKEFNERRKTFAEAGRRGAQARWGGDSPPIATPQHPYGEGIASFYLSLLSDRSLLTDKQKFEEARQKHDVSDAQVEHLRALSKEFGRDCLCHYLRQLSLHLKGDGAAKADFLAYVEKCIRRDAQARSGWFSSNTFKAQSRPELRPVRGSV